MKGIIVAAIILLLASGANAFAADGDLIVNGKVGIGTTSPGGTLSIQSDALAGTLPAQEVITGKTNPNQQLYFGIFTNGGATAGDYAFIQYLQQNVHWGPIVLQRDGGSIGIGTINPKAKFSVSFNNDDELNIYSPSDNQLAIQTSLDYQPIGSYGGNEGILHLQPAAGRVSMVMGGGNVGIGTTDSAGYKLYVNGAVYAASYAGSDLHFKKDIEPILNSTSLIQGLQGVRFKWKAEEFKDRNFDTGSQIGLIAQDVEKVLPEIVKTDTEGYKAVSYEKLTAVLIEAIKEQQKTIGEQQRRMERLEIEIGAMKVRQ